MQVLDYYMVPAGGMAARFEDGEIRSLSKCETLSILQHDHPALPCDETVRQTAPSATTHIVRITATRSWTTHTGQMRRVA